MFLVFFFSGFWWFLLVSWLVLGGFWSVFGVFF